MTPPRRIGAVVIPRPWESESDLRQLQGLDLHEMDAAQLERERRRLDVALGVADDTQFVEPMYVLSGAAPMTVGRHLRGASCARPSAARLSGLSSMTNDLHDHQAEEAALAAAVTNPAACSYLVEHCYDEDFGSADRRAVMHALAKLHGAGDPIDPVTVCTAVGSEEKPEDAARLKDYVRDLCDAHFVAANTHSYVATVGHSAKRRAVNASRAIEKAAFGCNGNVAELPERLEAITAAAVQEMRGRGGQGDGDRFRTAAFIAEHTPEKPPALIDDVLFAAHSHLLIGSPKESGKSTLCFTWAAAIADGSEWAGRRTQEGAVVYLLEEGAYGQGCKIHKHGLTKCENVHVAGPADLAGLDFAARIDATCKFALDVGAVVVFIDTLAAIAGVHDEDENSSGAMLEVVAQVDRLKQAGLGVVLSQHSRKSGGSLAEIARGSSAITGGVDLLIGLEPAKGSGHDNRRVLTFKGRIDVPPTLVVDLGKDGMYSYVGDVAASVRKDARSGILALLGAASEPLTEAVVVEELQSQGIGRTSVQDALRELLEEHIVGREKGVGAASNRAFGYYLIVDEPPGPQLPAP